MIFNFQEKVTEVSF